MKRFALFFVAIGCICALSLNLRLSLIALPNNTYCSEYLFYIYGKVEFYGETDIAKLDGARIEKSGNLTTIILEHKDAKALKRCLKNLDGETAVYFYDGEKSEEIDKLTAFYKIKEMQVCELSGRTIISGTTNKLSGGKTVDGRRINIQIALTDNKVIIGTPLILGSF